MVAPEGMNEASEAADVRTLGTARAPDNETRYEAPHPAQAAAEIRSVAGAAGEGSVGARPVPRVVQSKPLRPVAVQSSRLTHRTVTCCWPIGEPGTKTFRFCDSAAAGGKPYCTEHAQLAYVKVRDRREDAA
jgi:GcrA cell cycle regulator